MHEEYEQIRGDLDLWRALTQQVKWGELVKIGKQRCSVLRDSRGLLGSSQDVARYNFELGMIAGIEWLLQMPEAQVDVLQEQVDELLTIIKERTDGSK